MGALIQLLSSAGLGRDQVEKYRRDLVSGRAALSGTWQVAGMTVEQGQPWPDLADAESGPRLRQLAIATTSRRPNYGFVFDEVGVQLVSEQIRSGSVVDLTGQVSQHFRFVTAEQAAWWQAASAPDRRRLVKEDLRQLVAQTAEVYRTHGDRLHYLVVGKVTLAETRGGDQPPEERHYPLLLFTCLETDPERGTVRVEQAGVANFWLDEHRLGGQLRQQLGGWEVVIDEHLPAKLDRIQRWLATADLPGVAAVSAQPLWGMMGVVTGFEAEYVDPAWQEILRC